MELNKQVCSLDLAKQDEPEKKYKCPIKKIKLIKNKDNNGYFIIDVNNQIITTKINEIIKKVNILINKNDH
jgi:glycine/serine hydroxymethyltransferase